MALTSTHLKRQLGFSLVELMITVAIVALLSSIAMPEFRRLIIRARHSEAVSLMGYMYTVEKAYYAQYNTYSSRLDALGYAPDGNTNYVTGFFMDFAGSPEAYQGTPGCVATCPQVANSCPLPHSWVCTPFSIWANGVPDPACAVTSTTFLACAHGHWDGSNQQRDTYYMDQNGTLKLVDYGSEY